MEGRDCGLIQSNICLEGPRIVTKILSQCSELSVSAPRFELGTSRIRSSTSINFGPLARSEEKEAGIFVPVHMSPTGKPTVLNFGSVICEFLIELREFHGKFRSMTGVLF
jgi:hypothetical protein